MPVADAPADLVRDVLRQRYGRLRSGVKLLAGAAQVSHRTAENWLNGRASPNLDNIIPLMAACDDLAVAVLKLVEERKCTRR